MCLLERHMCLLASLTPPPSPTSPISGAWGCACVVRRMRAQRGVVPAPLHDPGACAGDRHPGGGPDAEGCRYPVSLALSPPAHGERKHGGRAQMRGVHREADFCTGVGRVHQKEIHTKFKRRSNANITVPAYYYSYKVIFLLYDFCAGVGRTRERRVAMHCTRAGIKHMLGCK
ncbi:hypothetical protein T492DRAFT_842500 [Pavlovales sp. CCMP2436]|nr:hypothetical protein T492DRAFT_842500 [Pavlovales sp. CCMP2436]